MVLRCLLLHSVGDIPVSCLNSFMKYFTSENPLRSATSQTLQQPFSRRRFDSSSRRRFKYSLKFMPVSSLNFSEFRNIFHTMTIILYQLLVFNFMEYINISKDSEIKNVIDIYIRIESFKSYGLLQKRTLSVNSKVGSILSLTILRALCSTP